MTKMQVEDIFVSKIRGNVYCPNCAKDEGIEEITAKDVILRKELENALQTLYFCDLCKERIV